MMPTIEFRRRRAKPPSAFKSAVAWVWFLAGAILVARQVWSLTTGQGSSFLEWVILIGIQLPLLTRFLLDIIELTWLDGWLADVLRGFLSTYVRALTSLQGFWLVLTSFMAILSVFSLLVSISLSPILQVPRDKLLDLQQYVAFVATAVIFSYWGQSVVRWLAPKFKVDTDALDRAEHLAQVTHVRRTVYFCLIVLTIWRNAALFLDPIIKLHTLVGQSVFEALITFMAIDTLVVNFYKPLVEKNAAPLQ